MKYLLGVALGLLLSANVAKADGFNPADVFPGELVSDLSVQHELLFGYTLESVNVTYLVEVLDVSPQGAEFWGFCLTPQALGPSPFCPSEGPIPVFEPAGPSLTLPRQHLDSIPGFR